MAVVHEMIRQETADLVGIAPIQLGVILVMAALIGTVSPPLSFLLYSKCRVAKIPLRAISRILWSYLAAILAVVALCILLPRSVTWLAVTPATTVQ